MVAFEPKHVIPGYEHVTTLENAKKDTHAYFRLLRDTVSEFMEEGGDMADIGRLDQSMFSYLQNCEFLAGRNAQQVY